MKKTTNTNSARKTAAEVKQLRTIAEIVADHDAIIAAYNTAVKSDAKVSELDKLNAQTAEIEKEYSRSAFHAQCLNLFALNLSPSESMHYAAENLFYTIRKHKDVEDDNGITRVAIEKNKGLDLAAVAEFFADRKKQFGNESIWMYKVAAFNKLLCLRAAVRIGADAKKVAEEFRMPKAAKEVSLGKTPTSNTQLLKQLQAVIDSMCFIPNENGTNTLKVNSHDVAYLTDLYAKRGREVLTIATARPKYMEKLIAEILFKIVTERTFGLEYQKEKVEQNKKAKKSAK